MALPALDRATAATFLLAYYTLVALFTIGLGLLVEQVLQDAGRDSVAAFATALAGAFGLLAVFYELDRSAGAVKITFLLEEPWRSRSTLASLLSGFVGAVFFLLPTPI